MNAHDPNFIRFPIGRPFNEAGFEAEFQQILADVRRRRELRAKRDAWWDSTMALLDEQYDHNVEREENGDGCPW